jgi:cytoskeletal protein CcmA (bactofilin family)
VKSVSENLNNNARHPQTRTDTLIGAGTRFDGHFTFTGVLRVEGEVVGDVTCGPDAQGTVIVGKSGSVTGAVAAPHVVVAGRVAGSVESAVSLEIRQGASIKGDASYLDLVVYEGAVVEGMLTPRFRIEKKEGSGPLPVPQQPAAAGRRALGVSVALAGIVALGLAIFWWTARNPVEMAKPVAVQPVPQAVTLVQTPKVDVPASAAVAVVSMPEPVVSTPAPVVAPPVTVAPAQTTASPPPEPRDITLVRGDDSSKPGDFVYAVAGKEAAVLFKAQRNDPTHSGKPIQLAAGASKRIALGKDEMLRVEGGRGLQLFYQGRKVPAATIDSGAWMGFAASSKGGGNGN